MKRLFMKLSDSFPEGSCLQLKQLLGGPHPPLSSPFTLQPPIHPSRTPSPSWSPPPPPAGHKHRPICRIPSNRFATIMWLCKMCIHLSTPPLGRLLQISQVQPGFRQVRPIFRGKSFHLLKVQQRSNELCCNNYCYGRALVTHLSLFILHTYSVLMHTYLLL